MGMPRWVSRRSDQVLANRQCLGFLIEEDAMNADTPAGTVWHVTMSLDGYIAGPDDTMDWA